ncbi:hypothetical protein CKO12_13765 [Chromatium okenii]|uniref:hypothetical protein n=1 Tax=Chromatium okenii TaxID=61644 RepID=UPI001907B362|nr:hypothetical protein [Chromatium okenii]MBK1642915.1 hypothetical protein [Chromatium okenii]
MRTLELHFGLGRIHLSPAAGSELILDCAESDRPQRTESPDCVTLSAKPRTVLGISVPRSLSWALQVPTEFDRIIVQAAGATVISNTLEWADVRLEGAASCFECDADHLGAVALVGTGQSATLRVERLNSLSLDGLNNRATVVHGAAFTLERSCQGPSCRIDAPQSQPHAQHRLQCRLNGLRQMVEIQHAAP